MIRRRGFTQTVVAAAVAAIGVLGACAANTDATSTGSTNADATRTDKASSATGTSKDAVGGSDSGDGEDTGNRADTGDTEDPERADKPDATRDRKPSGDTKKLGGTETHVTASPIFRATYESGTDSSGVGVGTNECCSYSVTPSSTLARTGKYSIRSYLKYGDAAVNNGTRAESYKWTEATRYSTGSTFYYGFSIYVPSTWETDVVEDMVIQWKAFPDSCDDVNYPSAFLAIEPTGRWQLQTNSDTSQCSSATSVNVKDHDVTAVQKGRWNDFVFKFHWDYDADGTVEAWHKTNKDSSWTKVLNKAGGNTFNSPDTTKGYLKWGIYKPTWGRNPTAVQSRSIWHDNVAIGTSFDAVNPSK